MNGTVWLPSITIALFLIGGYILFLSGAQTTTWPKKILRLILTLIITYLLLPLILNSSSWAMHGPSPLPDPPAPNPREELTGRRYCELTRDPKLSSEKFLERLSPFLRTAPIATPSKNPELLKAWGETPSPQSPAWELHPPAGFALAHTETLLKKISKKSAAEQSRTLLFLLQLGNQLSSLPFPETYEAGRNILRKTLVYCAKNQNLIATPEIRKELETLQTLPNKLEETRQRDKQRRRLQIESHVWKDRKTLSLKSLLIERNTLLATQRPLNEAEKTELGHSLLLSGQLYHYHLLHHQPRPKTFLQKPPPEDPSLKENIEDSLSRLAALLAKKIPPPRGNTKLRTPVVAFSLD